MPNIELSVSPDYVKEWGFTDAVREIFQNALDQQTVNPDNEMLFSYDPEALVLEIGNKASTLDTSTLVLGRTTKDRNTNLIGQFGEGYKLALVVLLRLGKSVTIYNNPDVWTPSIRHSAQFNTPVLNINIVKYRFKALPTHDLVFRVAGVTGEEYEKIKESNLHFHNVGETLEHTCGRILLDEKYTGKVYVHGLYITTIGKASYGYNFKPGHVDIGRDRNLVNEFNIFWKTSEMWAEQGGHAEIVEHMLQTEAPDTEWIHNYMYKVPKHTVERIACSFFGKHGCAAMPVASQQQADLARQMYGADVKVVMVTKQILEILKLSDQYKEFTPVQVTKTKPHDYVKPLMKKIEKCAPTIRPQIKALYEMSKHWKWSIQ